MQLISNLEQLRKNVKRFDDYLTKGSPEGKKWAQDHVQRGLCFVVYMIDEEMRFAPSRFVGYENNTIGKHTSTRGKDGRKTNLAINEILDGKPSPNSDMLRAYLGYCARLRIVAQERGPFDTARKFWQSEISV